MQMEPVTSTGRSPTSSAREVECMSFLQRFFNATSRESAPGEHNSSFAQLSDEELEAHLGVVRYGDFSLTEAIRPSYDLKVVPKTGYRHDLYRDEESNTNVPVLMA